MKILTRRKETTITQRPGLLQRQNVIVSKRFKAPVTCPPGSMTNTTISFNNYFFI